MSGNGSGGRKRQQWLVSLRMSSSVKKDLIHLVSQLCEERKQSEGGGNTKEGIGSINKVRRQATCALDKRVTFVSTFLFYLLASPFFKVRLVTRC